MDAQFKFPVSSGGSTGWHAVRGRLGQQLHPPRRVRGLITRSPPWRAPAAKTGELVDGDGQTARFKNPQGLVLTEDGTLYVADALNNAIRKITFQ